MRCGCQNALGEFAKCASRTAASLLLVSMVISAASAQSWDELRSLNSEIIRLTEVGKYEEATEAAKQLLTITEKKVGPNQLSLSTPLSNLANLHVKQGKLTEAEPLYKRALSILEPLFPDGHPDIAECLSSLASLYDDQSRLTEAEPLYKRALEMREKALPAGHPDIALSLNNLGSLYISQGRLTEAEPLYKRALEIWNASLPADHPRIALILNNLGFLFKEQGRLSDAEPLYRQALEIREKSLSPGHPDIARSLNNLAILFGALNRTAEAEPLLNRALEMREKSLPPGHPDIAQSFNNLALHYQRQNRLAEAEAMQKRALDIWEKSLPTGHPNIATALNNLALLYRAQGKLLDAEPLFKRVIEMQEKALPVGHPAIAQSLNNLAALYDTQGRPNEAEPLLRRALEILKVTLPDAHLNVAVCLNNLAHVLQGQARLSEAEQIYKRALEIREKALPAGHSDIAESLNNLAHVYLAQGRPSDAEPLFKHALEISEKALPAGHPAIATPLNNLAALYLSRRRIPDALPNAVRALEIREKALPANHPDMAQSLNNLAYLYSLQRKWDTAHLLLGRGTDILIQRSRRGSTGGSPAPVGGANAKEVTQGADPFNGFIKVAYRLSVEQPARSGELTGAAFARAQWGKYSASAASLVQMAERGTKGDPALAALVRQRQDLQAEWQKLDMAVVAASALPADQRNAAGEQVSRDRLANIDASIATIDQKFSDDFPEYAALATSEPLTIEAAQAQLRDDEALVLMVDSRADADMPEEVFVWVLTKTDSRWVRSNVGTQSLQERVTALRCGLDFAAWIDQRCADLLKGAKSQLDVAATQLPFDTGRAHTLYNLLFGRVTDLIKGKSLLVVPSGPLAHLPLHLLVTEVPKSGSYRDTRWLARDHAITILPSVASLGALRRVAKPSIGNSPFVGFGNPLLDGHDATHAGAAEQARQNSKCPVEGPTRLASSMTSLRGRLAPIRLRAGLADLAHLKAQSPLPETANELCAVARIVGADLEAVHLAARATEREIKAMSRAGSLARYRMIHFATHGVLAGQLRGAADAGLILTPPDAATEEDDGFLSATEVAGLKLDADLVILSACSTAGHDTNGTESTDAVAALGRAFFYAGARSLLVSHWAVDSAATVKLITGTIREMRADPAAGRAEALRRAMVATIDNGTEAEAHPAMWAPFVLVGEAGRLDGAAQAPDRTKSAAEPVHPVAAPPTRTFAVKTAKAQRRSRANGRPATSDDWRATAFPKP